MKFSITNIVVEILGIFRQDKMENFIKLCSLITPMRGGLRLNIIHDKIRNSS